jgi:hypothetical protein
VGKAAALRRQAEGALRLLADRHGNEKVVEAASRAYGDEAADALKAMLTVDPLELLPTRIPVVGEWADVGPLGDVTTIPTRRHTGFRPVIRRSSWSSPAPAGGGSIPPRTSCQWRRSGTGCSA